MLIVARGCRILAVSGRGAFAHTQALRLAAANGSQRTGGLKCKRQQLSVQPLSEQGFLADVVSASPTHVCMSVCNKYTRTRGSERMAKNSWSVGVLIFCPHSWEPLALPLYCSLRVSAPLRRKIPALVLVLSLGVLEIKRACG